MSTPKVIPGTDIPQGGTLDGPYPAMRTDPLSTPTDHEQSGNLSPSSDPVVDSKPYKNLHGGR